MSIFEQTIYLLLVTPHAQTANLIKSWLAQAEEAVFDVEWHTDYELVSHSLRHNQYHLHLLTAADGLRLLQTNPTDGFYASVVLFSEQHEPYSTSTAVEAITHGAADYLHLDQLNPALLERALLYALARQQQRESSASPCRNLRILLNTVEEQMMLLALDGTIICANKAVSTAFDSVSSLVGHSLWNILTPMQRHTYITKFQVALRSTQPRFFVEQEGKRWLEYHFYPIQNKQGFVDQIVLLIRDLTMRHDPLHNMEDLLRKLVSSLSDHVYATQITPHGEWINLYQSPNLKQITGYSPQKFIENWQLWLQELIHPADRERAEKQVERLQAGLDSAVEYRLKRADGHYIWLSDRAQVNLVGDSLIVYGLISDISKQRTTEEALRNERALLQQRVQEHTKALSQANRHLSRVIQLKDDFLANMSHELRTPLNNILTLCEILEEESFGSLSEKQQYFVETIGKSGRHLLELISDILDLSKLELDNIELEITSVFVDELCETSMRFVKQVAFKKQVELQYSNETEVRIIQADELRLKQIFVNLLGNAIKFTPPGGQVGLQVSSDSEAGEVQFVIWDTGVGIAQEDLSRLFEPFVQLENNAQVDEIGTGLGLSISRRLVERHGGQILVESVVGQGSRFTVKLPWQAQEEQQLLQTAQAKFDSNGTVVNKLQLTQACILLAEDDNYNREVLSNYLLHMGYRLCIAETGLEAVEKTMKLNPDLILMDIQMPELSGFRAIERLREADIHTPIIALTALAMPGDRERCLACGADDYLSKPVALQNLVAVIEMQLQHSKAAHPNSKTAV